MSLNEQLINGWTTDSAEYAADPRELRVCLRSGRLYGPVTMTARPATHGFDGPIRRWQGPDDRRTRGGFHLRTSEPDGFVRGRAFELCGCCAGELIHVGVNETLLHCPPCRRMLIAVQHRLGFRFEVMGYGRWAHMITAKRPDMCLPENEIESLTEQSRLHREALGVTEETLARLAARRVVVATGLRPGEDDSVSIQRHIEAASRDPRPKIECVRLRLEDVGLPDNLITFAEEAQSE